MEYRQKYPRTPHLPWSPGVTNDDKIIKSLGLLYGRNVVVTEKMDGENITLYHDGFHARSLDSRHHSSRDWLAQFHAKIAHDIPQGMRICGEYLYARHSIAYSDLPSYFLGFSAWEKQMCLPWDETLEFFELLEITPVPVLWRGEYDPEVIQKLMNDLGIGTPGSETEGYVVRYADAFHASQFDSVVAKFVRAGHVQTDKHWMHDEIVPNKMRTPPKFETMRP